MCVGNSEGEYGALGSQGERKKEWDRLVAFLRNRLGLKVNGKCETKLANVFLRMTLVC